MDSIREKSPDEAKAPHQPLREGDVVFEVTAKPKKAREEKPADKDDADDKPESPEDARKKRRNWIIVGIVGAILLVAVLWYAIHYFTTGRYFVSTDDAYTQADNVAVSAQVSGTIAELSVTDNQRVRKGDVIARIDDRTYRAAVDQAKADVASAVANVHNAEAQFALQQATITQAQSDVGSVQAQLQFAEDEDVRYSTLAQHGTGTVQQAQQARSNLLTQRAALVKAEANLQAAQKQLDVLQTTKEQADAAVQRATASVAQAEVNLGYTVIAAPADGAVADRSARVGIDVQPGTRLLTLVPVQSVYVVANYKETQLARMHEGQPVAIVFDTFPGVTVHGRVDSLQPGSGSVFSLLPPENATGNFTKIVQRVPVKILIDADDQLAGRLRPGLSVEPTVDTRDSKGKALLDRPTEAGAPPPDGSATGR